MGKWHGVSGDKTKQAEMSVGIGAQEEELGKKQDELTTKIVAAKKEMRTKGYEGKDFDPITHGKEFLEKQDLEKTIETAESDKNKVIEQRKQLQAARVGMSAMETYGDSFTAEGMAKEEYNSGTLPHTPKEAEMIQKNAELDAKIQKKLEKVGLKPDATMAEIQNAMTEQSTIFDPQADKSSLTYYESMPGLYDPIEARNNHATLGEVVSLRQQQENTNTYLGEIGIRLTVASEDGSSSAQTTFTAGIGNSASPAASSGQEGMS